ncbi:MAG TPA: HTH-type transcriptional activator IlvY [Pseudomonadales bacterium]|nr:HTH-type transcriptional activator IlvY [Pseudomonadales bacterium]
MQQKDLELFITLCETLHFARAGELMHMSPSAVSRHVQRIEQAMGVPLLKRDNRRVMLTREGLIFKRHAEQMLSSWQAMQRDLYSEDKALSGEISLYCSVTAAYSVLVNIMEQMRRRYPDVELKLHTGDEAIAIDRVAAGKEDIAIAAHPEQLSQRLNFLTLTHSPLVFIQPVVTCPSESLLAEAQAKGDLPPWGQLPFIMQEVGLARRQLDAWFANLGIEPNIYAQVSGHEAIVSMVALGLGIGVVPELVLQSSPLSGKVSVLDVQPPLRPYAVGLCALQSQVRNDLIHAFWDCAKSAYAIN